MEAVEAVRTFLTESYRQLDPDFSDLAAGFSDTRPGWHWVNEELARTERPSPHGLLLDPDVGVALFFVRFSARDTDVRAQISKAVAYRSRMLPQRVAEADSDTYGSWRVLLHWLVDEADLATWQEQASILRRDTAYMEELPADAIARPGRDSWPAAVRRHGLPRLLLRTRRVLRMPSSESVFQWSNANARVRAALKDFSERFSGQQERELARKVEARMASAMPGRQDNGASVASAAPVRLASLAVRQFRNLKEVQLDFSGAETQAAIIHGPNGSGKSSLFEALEFALRGTSKRAEDFLADSDVTTTRKPREYLERYLRPFGREGGTPTIELNGREVPFAIERAGIPQLSGNLLSQDDSGEFIDKRANDLAAEIVGEFSGLADDLIDYADAEQAQAQANLKNMLASFGLDRPGAITRQDTARAKVAETRLRDVVATPAHLLTQLQHDALSWSPLTSTAMSMASAMLAGQDSLGDASGDIGKALAPEELKAQLLAFLRPVWRARRDADRFLESLARLRTDWPADLAARVDLWGRWLAERHNQQAEPSADLAEKQGRRKQLGDTLETLTRRGTLLRERERHFEGLQQFLHGAWKNSGDEHCPTCNTDFSERGGIVEAVAAVRQANAETLAAMRREYAETQAKLAALDKELQLADKTRCPLPEDAQAAVRQALAPCLPAGIDLDSVLAAAEERARCLAWIEAVTHLPAAPQFSRGSDDEQQAADIAADIQATYEQLERGFPVPDAWKTVAKELKDRLAEVLKEHLPDTLGGLWRELVWNLTPAPWQIRGGIDVQLENRRGKQEARLTVDVDGSQRLARYVLNEAEKLALGLGWFLVRHVSFGRFRHAVLALDDPALDMDQTTFRDLCRLLESLLRLHRRYRLPLALLVFLHQDERALDAARATGGLLHRLTWNAGQAELATSVRLFADTYRHPLPRAAVDPAPTFKVATA